MSLPAMTCIPVLALHLGGTRRRKGTLTDRRGPAPFLPVEMAKSALGFAAAAPVQSEPAAPRRMEIELNLRPSDQDRRRCRTGSGLRRAQTALRG